MDFDTELKLYKELNGNEDVKKTLAKACDKKTVYMVTQDGKTFICDNKDILKFAFCGHAQIHEVKLYETKEHILDILDGYY